MLILVGVTISVALNGGLFKTAQDAATNTIIEAEKEQLLSAITVAYDVETGTINKAKLEANLGTGWSVEGENAPYTVTSPKGNKYTVNVDGTIEFAGNGGGQNPGGDEPTESWVDNGDGTFTKGDTTIKIGETTYTNEEVKEKLGTTGGTYTGTWTVIGVEGNKLKLATTDNVGTVELGYNDKGAIEEIKATDENNPTDAEKFERSIWSYKNAVNTLTTAAQTATGIESAKSITIEDIYGILGEENINKGTEYGKIYNYKYNITASKVYSKYQTGTDENGEISWSDPVDTGDSSQTFVDKDGNTIVVDSKDDNVTLTNTDCSYELSEDQKTQIGALALVTCWLASPCVDCDSDSAYFSVPLMGGGSLINIYPFHSNGSAYSIGLGVCAVVSISGL